MKHHGMHEEQTKNHGEYAKQLWDFYYMQNPELALNLDLVNWSYTLSPCKNVHTKEKEKEKEKEKKNYSEQPWPFHRSKSFF